MATLAQKPQTSATRPTAPAKLTPCQTAEALLQEYASVYRQRAEIDAAAKAAKDVLTKKLDGLNGQLEAWTNENPGEFKGKLLKLESGEFGYKAGAKKLRWDVALEDEYEQAMLDEVAAVLPLAIVRKLDETKVAKLWSELPALQEVLGNLGARVEQLDNFIIMPKK